MASCIKSATTRSTNTGSKGPWRSYIQTGLRASQRHLITNNLALCLLLPGAEKKLIEELNRMSDSPALQPHDERNSDKLNYVTVIKNVRMRKGKWQRFSTDQEQRILGEKKGA